MSMYIRLIPAEARYEHSEEGRDWSVWRDNKGNISIQVCDEGDSAGFAIANISRSEMEWLEDAIGEIKNYLKKQEEAGDDE